jgi:tripartite-type tricarboxylate transporter receptor subunit TctC
MEMKSQSIFLASAMTMAALLGSAPSAAAQSYPARVVKIVVAGGPGGPNDIVARLSADAIAKLGQSVIVEHRPGGGGVLGAREVAKAAPDGHTLLVGNTATLAVLPATQTNTGYDPAVDFAPIAKFWESYQVLVVPPKAPPTTLKDFIATAKAQPGKLNYAHAGIGGLPHLAIELFKARASIDVVGVAYRSDAEAMTATMTGIVQLAVPNIGVALPLIRDGRLHALGVTSSRRLPTVLDLPTVSESGLQDYEIVPFFGLVAPAGTPRTIVDRLNTLLNETLATDQARELIQKIGAVPTPGTPEAFAAFLSKARGHWATAARSAGFGTK